MSQFEYTTVLVSIVIAFAASEILSGLGGFIRERHRVRFYWVHVSWMVLALLGMIGHWWGIWEYRTVEFDSFYEFLGLLAPSLTFVLAAFVVTPSLGTGAELDLRAYYFQNRMWMFPIASVILIEFGLQDRLLGGTPDLAAEHAFWSVAIAILLWLGFTKDPRVHGIAVLVVYVLFALNWVLFTSR